MNKSQKTKKKKSVKKVGSLATSWLVRIIGLILIGGK